jgi:DNA-binding MarR family transcriptional regulator
VTSDVAEAAAAVRDQADSENQAGEATAEASQAAEIADAMVSLIHTYQNLKSRVTNSLDPELASLFLLVRLVRGGPKRAKELADAMCADQSTVSRQVAALVKSGLIERQADPDDGRASILVPTQLGRERVQEHFVNRGQGVEPIIADWPESDRGQFLRLLRQYNSALEGKREEVMRNMTRGHSLKHVALAPPYPTQHEQNPTQHPPTHHRMERSN